MSLGVTYLSARKEVMGTASSPSFNVILSVTEESLKETLDAEGADAVCLTLGQHVLHTIRKLEGHVGTI